MSESTTHEDVARREAWLAERSATWTPERRAELEAGWAKLAEAKAEREARRAERQRLAEEWDAEARKSARHRGGTHRHSAPQHGRAW
jgi:hypothetical protein